jgi:integrase/recombinase XerC
MQTVVSAVESGRQAWAGELDAVLADLFGAGVRPLRLEEALFEKLLEGWRFQQSARNLTERTKRGREVLARRVVRDLERWPWEWRPLAVEEWFDDLVIRGARRATRRNYQIALQLFLAYLCDRRYPWAAICERELGVVPVQAFDDLNLMRHLDDYEADPAKRPLTLEELHDFFAYCDAEFERRSRLGRKGALTAFRDTVVFKTIYAWGLRASEATQLNVVDFHRNATTPEFGRFGLVAVRVGKGSGGSGPRRREVLTVFDWSVEVIEQWLDDVRPRYRCVDHPAVFVTERGGRVSRKYISDRFAEYRDALRLERVLTTHCLRHSYLTHLAEDGWPALFAQLQAGHRYASTTAIYMSVSDGYKQTLVRDALDRQLAGEELR